MGKDLHHSILKFFFARMGEHNAISDVVPIFNEDDFIYRIERERYGDSMRLWLSDAYLFTETDYYNRPNDITVGDYIVIGKPEGGFSLDYDLIRREKIGVGKIGKFMGAVNLPEPWRFLDQFEREKLKVQRL